MGETATKGCWLPGSGARNTKPRAATKSETGGLRIVRVGEVVIGVNLPATGDRFEIGRERPLVGFRIGRVKTGGTFEMHAASIVTNAMD